MLFKDYHIPQIRSGEKTVTRREWAQNYAGPSVGTVVAATTELFVSDDEADCYIEIVDRYEQPLGEMSDEDARAEGEYEDLEEFRDGYERVYGDGAWDPEKVVEVVEFEYVGKSRPDEQKKLLTDGGVDQEEGTLVRVGDVVEHEEHGRVRVTDIEIKAEAVGPEGPTRRIGVWFESGLEDAFFGGEVAFWTDFREGIIEVNPDAE